MPQKPSFPPPSSLALARVPAAHVQTAVKAAQAKMPESSRGQVRPTLGSIAAADRPPQAPHVRRALAPAQAKLRTKVSAVLQLAERKSERKADDDLENQLWYQVLSGPDIVDAKAFAQFDQTYTAEDAMLGWINADGPLNHQLLTIGGRRRSGVVDGWDITLRWDRAINFEGVRRTVRMNIHYPSDRSRRPILGGLWMDGVHGHAINVENDWNITARATLRSMAEDIQVDQVPKGHVRF